MPAIACSFPPSRHPCMHHRYSLLGCQRPPPAATQRFVSRFDQHVDTCVKDGDGDVSEYTLLIYLNSNTSAIASSLRAGADGASCDESSGAVATGAVAAAVGASDDGDRDNLPVLHGGATVFYATAKR
jgi:hypothetical protein